MVDQLVKDGRPIETLARGSIGRDLSYIANALERMRIELVTKRVENWYLEWPQGRIERPETPDWVRNHEARFGPGMEGVKRAREAVASLG